MRFLIIDDHALIRKGVKQIIYEEYPLAEVEEAANAEEASLRLISGHWNIIISDWSMPGRSGLDVIHIVKQSAKETPVLILSIHPEDHYAIRALKAGAAGFLSKDSAAEDLVKAIQRILQGRKYISAAVAEILVNDLKYGHENKQPHELLSDRELVVFELISAGKSLKEISEQLSLNSTTISTYRTRIMVKMNFKSNADFIRYAIEHKI